MRLQPCEYDAPSEPLIQLTEAKLQEILDKAMARAAKPARLEIERLRLEIEKTKALIVLYKKLAAAYRQ
jgi:hypothetical protein